MLGWIIGLCHKTAEIHFPCMCCSTSECINRDTVVADGDEVCENWNPLPDLTLEGPHRETRTYVLKAELKTDAVELVKE